jgi:hypothetical protein
MDLLASLGSPPLPNNAGPVAAPRDARHGGRRFTPAQRQICLLACHCPHSMRRCRSAANANMTATNSKYGWPALMKATTARAYLDDMPIAEFAATVVPFLDARTGVGCIRYTRDSIDAWIGQGGRALDTSARSERTPAAGNGDAHGMPTSHVEANINLLERLNDDDQRILAAALEATARDKGEAVEGDGPTRH